MSICSSVQLAWGLFEHWYNKNAQKRPVDQDMCMMREGTLHMYILVYNCIIRIPQYDAQGAYVELETKGTCHNLISGSRAKGSLGRPQWKNELTGPEEQEDPEYAAYPANAGPGGPWAGQHPVTTKFHQVTTEPPVGLRSKKPWKIGWTSRSWKRPGEDRHSKLALRERHTYTAQS
eukprot:3172536-Amphidinium_carterae.1